MIDIKVREYCPDDLIHLIDLFRSSVRLIARRDYSERQVLAWAPDFIDPQAFALRHPIKATWVAEVSGQIAGFIDLEPDGHINMLYVHAAHQAKGVARTLLNQVEHVATDRRLQQLYTEASITGRPAFERSGFYVVKTQTVYLRNEAFTNYQMEKRLTALF